MKVYQIWAEFKSWLDQFGDEELIGVDYIWSKIDELESEYE